MAVGCVHPTCSGPQNAFAVAALPGSNCVMENYEPTLSFGPAVAANDVATTRGEEADIVAFLSGIARDRRCLEFAVGTGRIAVPLAKSGLGVDGVDLSADMLAALETRDGADLIGTVHGDMSEVSFDRTYGLVYLVHNSLFNVLTQDGQVRCFQNASRHLDDDGVFVIEATMPTRFVRAPEGQSLKVAAVSIDSLEVNARLYNPATQTIEGTRMRLSTDGIVSWPIVFRYAWPSEIDLMARIAGLILVDRWGGWNGEAFTSTSDRHISVYGRSDATPER